MPEGIQSKNMKRISIITLVISLLSFGFPSISMAATDGCPDTWVIDTSKFPNEDLNKAVSKYGPEIIVSENQPKKILTYAGIDGVSPKLANLESFFHRVELPSESFIGFDKRWRSFLYLYSKSTMQFTIKVEKKGCVNPGLFTFNTTVPTGGREKMPMTSALEVKKVSASKWAEDNPLWFTDFKAQAEFSNNLKKATVAVQSFLDNQKSLTKDQFVYPHVFLDPYLPNIFVPSNRGYINLIAQVLDPKCIDFVYSKEDKVYSPSIKLGKKCDFVWSVNNYGKAGYQRAYDDAFNELVIFDEIYRIDLSKKSVTINCTKGKVIKKVTGTSPKCPAGYKKK
jgi:hypothetical protein